MQQQMSPEQVQQLQEKLKNMSPEELKAYQKQNCIFCQIIDGKVQSKKIYEDKIVIGILDINPANPGHVLLLPKEHYAILPQVPENEISHIFMVAKAISNVMLRSLKSEGTTIFVANGVAAGQKAQHFMLHIIPRKDKDGVGLQIPQKRINENDLVQLQKKLVPVVNKVCGTDMKIEESQPKQEDVVEAEFKEESKPKEEDVKKEVEEELGKKEEPEETEQTPDDDDGVDLDDIAKVLNV